MAISRRDFMRRTAPLAGAVVFGVPVASRAEGKTLVVDKEDVSGGIVICNHWTQYGIGETFPEGEIRGRWYRRNFSSVFGIEQGRRWIEASPKNRVCHEFDAYFLDALAEEDPEYIGVIRDLLDRKLMELPGGTFGQAESQVFGYESALRQLTFGQDAYRRHLGRGVDTSLVEEQNFFPQLPQLLKLAGFKYASMQFQNSGTPDPLPDDIVLWESPDATAIPAIPNHPGLVSCARQWKPYDEMAAKLAGRKAPLIFQWMELWPPGLDWGASIAPYAEAIHEIEGKGFRQMLLTEYIEWALTRSEPPRVRIPLDKSNYNNNFFQGGWGYENEKTARGSNQCESLLLAAEALCAGGEAEPVAARIGGQLRDLWSRLLVSQNHDPYLAGSVPAYVDGARSFMSELAVKQLAIVQRTLREEAKIGAPLSRTDESFRVFNPCPWDVASPVLFELDDTVWPDHGFTLRDGQSETSLAALFRADNGNVLIGPAILRMTAYETRDLCLKSEPAASGPPSAVEPRLTAKRDGHVWDVEQEGFDGIEFEPLVGEWRQVPSYFDSMHPNINTEVAHKRIEEAPITSTSGAMDKADLAVLASRPNVDSKTAKSALSMPPQTATWRMDLMRIRDVVEPALSVQGLVFAGAEPVPFVQFNQRLTSTIRFETGKRPHGTWRFRLRARGTQPSIFADAPFSEEERRAESFYCARYIRLEWPGRHLLWCPSQNTLFRRIQEKDATVIECTVFDFSFTGTANWGMRFYAAKSFSAAESVRLAETFHRGPVRVPAEISAGRITGAAVDNSDVVITHAFPAGQDAVAVRMFNSTPDTQIAAVTWRSVFVSATACDLQGAAARDAEDLSAGSCTQWRYVFRPWEIATFRVNWR